MAQHADPPGGELTDNGQTPGDTDPSNSAIEDRSNEVDQTASSDIDLRDSQESAGIEAPSKTETQVDPTPDAGATGGSEQSRADGKRKSPAKQAVALMLVVIVAFVALAGWLGFSDYKTWQAKEQRELFLHVGRQGAINLTTIDWQHADADMQRILDSATGAFYDDFSKRSQPFIDVVKKAQSKSVGTITAAGLETQSNEEAQVLVAVSVKTSNLGATEQNPRHWRMRISVQKVGNELKVSNVAFVP